MNVLLIYTLRDVLTQRRPLASMGDIHIGLSYISSMLKARGHATRLTVLSSERAAASLARLEREVEAFDPQLVAYTAVSTQFPFVCTAANRIRERWPDRFQLLGGVHASLRPEESIQGPFDAICVGEGELPAVELADALAAGRRPSAIRNLWIKQPDGSVEKNPTREFAVELDALPFPDREMWHGWVLNRRAESAVILPSRGCPYNCSYCSNHALRKLAAGKYVRFRSPDAIARELRAIKARYPETKEVYLQSETIAVNAAWLEELAQKLQLLNAESDPPLTFACNFRVARQFLNDRIFAALARANVRTMEIGLESGSERVRCDVLRRHYSNAEFFQAVELARRHGMEVNVYNMIGLPGETRADHDETIRVNHQVCPSRSLTSIFFPYPGTDLFGTCETEGLVTAGAGHQTAERSRATLDLPGFSRKEIQRCFEWFEYRVYRGHRPWSYRIRKVLRNKAFSRAWSHAVFMRLLPLWHEWRGRK